MPVRERILLKDTELMDILSSINGADYAGQWRRTDENCEGVSKMLLEAMSRGLNVRELTEIADLAHPDTRAGTGP